MRHSGYDLTYCLNVHPGESWDAQLSAVRDHAVPIRNSFSPGRTFGLGLRLSAEAAKFLVGEPSASSAFRDEIQDANAYVATVNAFPFGAFHGDRVKDNVYLPDWSDSARLEYSCNVAAAVAGMSVSPCTVTVSTAPLTFKGWDGYEARLSEAVLNVARCAAELYRLEQETGVEVVLCIEPEPFCYPETTPELVDVLQRVWHEGAPLFAKLTGVTCSKAEAMLQRYIGCCFDTAHQAVEFEHFPDSLNLLNSAGVRVGKVQLSSAIEAVGADAVRELERFAEPTYLHQVCVRSGEGGVMRFADLSDALSSNDIPPGSVWRVHYHLPLFVESFGNLRSTSGLLQDKAFLAALNDSGCNLLEVETYTWDVWRENSGATDNIDEGILRELRWVSTELGV